MKISKRIIIIGLMSFILLTGCASINKKLATPFAASLGQAADVGTTAWALAGSGVMEGNPLLAGLASGSVVVWVVFSSKIFIPLLYDNGWMNKPTCEQAFRANGLIGFGFAGSNAIVIGMNAASATISTMAWPIAGGIALAVLLDGWLKESAKVHCANLPDEEELEEKILEKRQDAENGRMIWLGF